ncbi:phosphotransferase [Niameybacter massiliensis]|uniref:Phosphotransferase n=1 Tax=Holtiella tumoricola TaxID=3018743 RepID=A0AA42DMG0_9FIRM|nr:phosphotransferase [Holtiella tumoricola]MDA3731872.1 phosphotransferase [Holtiella tumoricola]
MFSLSEIKDICDKFDIECNQISDVIDTSRSEEDRRYNYKINNSYFLKINNSKAINEVFLEDIMNLTLRYKEIGVYCPSLIKDESGKLVYFYEKEDIHYACYVEECAPYKVYSSKGNTIDYTFKKAVVGHLGKLARLFSNINLSQTKSMWSLIELGPFDIDRDEKQENFDTLVNALKKCQEDILTEKLIIANQQIRKQIEKFLEQLPRCVYQGDLNESNILVDDEGVFKGIIDFNMFGTEVNINCFLNETMYYLEKVDFDTLTVQKIFSKMEQEQEKMLSEILKCYQLNSLEHTAWRYYKKIIYMSFYPNVCLWNSMLLKHQHVDKVLKLINIILEM